MFENDALPLRSLRWQGLLVTAFYCTVVALFYSYLRQVWHDVDAKWWLGLATFATAIQLMIFWWGLRFNHPPNRPILFSRLGFANSMTLTRGLLACLLAGFLFNPQPHGSFAWIPALLYTGERLLDYFDGFVARITERETKLGAILDMEFDGLGILIAAGLAIQYGKLPLWYLILGLGRQLFVFGMWVRQRLGKANEDLPPSDHRRLIAGFQTTFISVVLWPTLSNQIALFAGYLFAVPLILSFGRDWWVVSTMIDNQSIAYQTLRRQVKQIVEEWLPLFLRLVIVALTLSIGLNQIASGMMLVGWVMILLALGLGLMVRVAALGLIALVCTAINYNGLNSTNLLLLSAAIIILHLGSGRLALWTPEERILHMKLGEKTGGQ